MEQLSQYVPAELGILVATLWVIGYFVKQTNKISDAYIPFILMVLGIAGAVLIQGFTIISVLQGIICAAVAVFAKNVVKQGAEIIDSFTNTESK